MTPRHSDRRALWAEFRDVIGPALLIALAIGIVLRFWP